MWIDAHCHLSDPRYANNLGSVLERSRQKNVTAWVLGGTHPDDWTKQQALKDKHGQAIKTCFGLHPWWASAMELEEIDRHLSTLERELEQTDALGELGLDKLPRFATPQMQKRQEHAWKNQLALFSKVDRPWVLHVVRAHEDVLKDLKSTYRGLVHSFSADWKTAQAYLDRGFLISVSGYFTSHKPSAAFLEMLKRVPKDSLVLETDAPDQAPKGIEKDKNEPAHLPAIAQAIAEIRGEKARDLLESSTQSVLRLWK
jgi:TatD DNase family protein